ncbi:MAG: hypothetical protein ACFBSC_11980, partial [Microcoleaceae cyanobacterium]
MQLSERNVSTAQSVGLCIEPDDSAATSMLLVLPVTFRKKDEKLLLADQACNGLECWADNFGSVVLAAPVIPETLAERNKTVIWQDTSTLAQLGRFEFQPLPWAYSLPKFLACYREVRQQLSELISRCRYLQFGIGGLWGDWGAIAALEAEKQRRTYAIHTDRVEHEVIRRKAKGANLKTQIKARITSPLMAKYHERIIRHCTVGLWHGQDCYQAYSPVCKNNHLIHNIHLKPADSIQDADLKEKLEKLTEAS